MNHMELQRRLNNSGLSKEACYILSAMFEVQREQAKQLAECGAVIEALANSMQGFIALNGAMEERLQKVVTGLRHKGVDITSVIYDPSEGK